MGWGSGSSLFRGINNIIGHKITTEEYEELIELFENEDCDTLDEVKGLNASLDTALERRGYFKEWDDED